MPMMVFVGSGSLQLTDRICSYLQIPRGKKRNALLFSWQHVRTHTTNVHGQRVYIVQSTIFSTSDKFMELPFF